MSVKATTATNAPAEREFPSYPGAWYLFGESSDINRRPISKDLLGRRLVAFRTAGGRVAILDAVCSHMKADLGKGSVVGDCLRCPVHRWEYAADGVCRRIPAQPNIPEFASQRAFPAVERHGLIFFWNGPSPQFPLPFFAGVDPDGFVRARSFRFMADCSWVMLVANAFDGQHFQVVHDRRLLAPPQVDCPDAWSRRVQYHAEIVGTSIFDRLLKRYVGRTVQISIAIHGGPLVLVTGRFARAQSYILISTQPTGPQETAVEVVVFAPRTQNRLARLLGQRLGLELRRLFTKGFMADDITRLPGIRYNPQTLVGSDQMLVEFFQWLAGTSQNCP